MPSLEAIACVCAPVGIAVAFAFGVTKSLPLGFAAAGFAATAAVLMLISQRLK